MASEPIENRAATISWPSSRSASSVSGLKPRSTSSLSRQPLMVKTRSGHGVARVHTMVDEVDELVQNGRDDQASARAASRQKRFAIAKYQRWRHRRQRTLRRLDRIGLAADQPECVRCTRFRRKVVHFVVEQDAGSRHRDTGPVGEVQRVGICNDVPIAIGDRVVRRVRALIRRHHAGTDRLRIACAVGRDRIG